MSRYNRYALACTTLLNASTDWKIFERDFTAWARHAKVYTILTGDRPRPDAGDERDAWDGDHDALWNMLRGCIGKDIKDEFDANDDTAHTLTHYGTESLTGWCR